MPCNQNCHQGRACDCTHDVTTIQQAYDYENELAKQDKLTERDLARLAAAVVLLTGAFILALAFHA